MKSCVLLVITWFCLAVVLSPFLSPVTAEDVTGTCQFPFIFKNVTYTSCTNVDDTDGKLWCSTSTNSQNIHVGGQGKWKYCEIDRVDTKSEQNTDCNTYPENNKGECKKIQQCQSLNSMLKRIQSGQGGPNDLGNLRKSVCGNDGSSLLVCCPRTTTIPATSKPTIIQATPKPTRSPPKFPPKQCGTNYIFDRIVGGTDAQLTAWPWMVLFRAREVRSCNDNNKSCSGWASIGECQSNESFMHANCKKSCNKCPATGDGPGSWICGGVLIADQYVLTAAHCFKDHLQVEYVRIGEFDLSTDPDVDLKKGHTAPQPQDIDVERVIKHENYNTQNCRRCNDIALVKLAKPAQIHPFFVEPVCLPSNPEHDMGFSASAFKGKLGWATGWGVTDAANIFTTVLATKLQQVNLTIQDLDFCHKRKKNYPNENMILCAGQGDGRDTCRADSGGPIMLSDNYAKKWFVVGITSLGSAICGDHSAQGVFTSVHYYMDWIKRNIV